MASVNGATCAMCIEKSLDSVEFLNPATTDNVETAKNFRLWTELNFLARLELLRPVLHWYRRAEPPLHRRPSTRRDTLQLKVIQLRQARGTGWVPGRSDEGRAARGRLAALQWRCAAYG